MSLRTVNEQQKFQCVLCCVVTFRAYKTVQEEDLKFPLIYGEGKKVRLLTNV